MSVVTVITFVVTTRSTRSSSCPNKIFFVLDSSFVFSVVLPLRATYSRRSPPCRSWTVRPGEPAICERRTPATTFAARFPRSPA
ncbi:hypothetical protein PF004_g31044, partial [Phytophthora fragariae]